MIPVHLFDLLRCVLRHSDCRHEQRAAAPASVQFHRMGRFSETVFGDTDDPNSKISKILARRKWKRLIPEAGTDPNIYYLI